MTYEQTLDYIHSVSWKGSRPGLERITELMHRLGDPQNGMKFIHIVGTNGKGSTAAMLSSVLTKAGYRTGMFTSPYVLCFRERMQFCGEMISEQELAAVTESVRPFADSMEDKPTEFELITAIGLVWFARKNCDIVVLEAGMGGALDSTNVIPAPEIAVFTNIGLDHTQYLGDTAEKIASTKAGILKPGCDCVLYPNTPSVEQVIRARCEKHGISLTVPKFADLRSHSSTLDGQLFDFENRTLLYLPLLGMHQLHNAAVVLTVLDRLKARGWVISEGAIRAGLANTNWPGRFEVLSRDPLVLLDGGHNPQCMQALSQAVCDYLPDRKLVVLTGVLADKDYDAMFRETAQYASAFVTVAPPNPRALSAADLAAFLQTYGKPVTVCETVEAGVSEALCQAKAQNAAVLAYGSLYMAGTIRTCVQTQTVR